MTDIKTQLSQFRLDGSRGYWKNALDQVNSQDVLAELETPPGRYSIQRLVRLLSPAARDYLEPMAQQAQALTCQRFGKTIALFEPLYVSNVCVNSCVYCGFNRTSDLPRAQLTVEQAMSDARAIAEQGFRDILLVSGEDPKFASVEYFCELARQLRPLFSSISLKYTP
jgi:2-iminoacetate synthase